MLGCCLNLFYSQQVAQYKQTLNQMANVVFNKTHEWNTV